MIRDARSTKAAELTRKDMKAPDRFQVLATQAGEWGTKHRTSILAGVGALVVALAAVLAFQAYQRSERGGAGGALYRALDAEDGIVSAVPLPGADRPIYASEAEKDRAVIAESDRVRREHAGTRAAATAALVSGEAHLRLGEWDPAAADFQGYLAATPAEDALRYAALEGLARVAEAKKDVDGAVRAWERLGQEAPFLKDRAALERARVLAAAGKKDEARKLLAAFPEEFKESPLKTDAQERLARVDGK